MSFSQLHVLIASAMLALIRVTSAVAIDSVDTCFLKDPAICDSHIAFVYANHVWLANPDGSNARRLTEKDGSEANPQFSPDEVLLAYTATYDGGNDVYVTQIANGNTLRLTWHPGDDEVVGFDASGHNVLFRSQRTAFAQGHAQLYSVSTSGGFPTQLPMPSAFKAAYSPDGKQLAYVPLADQFEQWKHYRGGATTEVHYYRFYDGSVNTIPQPPEGCNDTDPMWTRDRIYFRSNRNGEFNLFAFDMKRGDIKQLTHFTDFPVLNPSIGSGKLIYEQAGYLHTLDTQDGTSIRLTISVRADQNDMAPIKASDVNYIRSDNQSADISPDGTRAVFSYRGEVVVLSAEDSSYENISRSSGVHERSPVWSPNGKKLAYFSDAPGEYELHIRSLNDDSVRRIELRGAGFYDTLSWSPDGKSLGYSDNSHSRWWVDIESGIPTQIDTAAVFGPSDWREDRCRWSPDSKWIAYSKTDANYLRRIYLYSIDSGKSYLVAGGSVDAWDPVFDGSGRYLYFVGSTDSGPRRQWFNQSKEQLTSESRIYVAALTTSTPLQLPTRSKEVDDGSEPQSTAFDDIAQPTVHQIEPKNIDRRIAALPLPSGIYSSLKPGRKGNLLFLKTVAGADSQRQLMRFRLHQMKADLLVDNAHDYCVATKSQAILYRTWSDWCLADYNDPTRSSRKLHIGGIEVAIQPRLEWRQIFNEVWRLNRDNFYAPNYHGANWKAVRDKYSPFLEHIDTRDDLTRLLRWMCSELSVSHSRVLGPPPSAPRSSTGLLGADFEIENGAYRIKAIYSLSDWTSELRSPLASRRVDVVAGDYIIEVNGKRVDASSNIFRYFEGTVDKPTELTVSNSSNGQESRTITVVPVSDEFSLRHHVWRERNRKYVEATSSGRLGYIYFADTGRSGLETFRRQYYSLSNRDGLVIDARFNGGGLCPDYVIDLLSKARIGHMSMRYGTDDISLPSESFAGRTILITQTEKTAC